MSMFPIAQYTADNTVQSSFGNIPQNFAHLELHSYVRTGTGYNFAQDFTFIRFNGDNSNNYFSNWMEADGSNTSASNIGLTSYIRTGLCPANSATAGLYGVSILQIFDYSNTSKFKTVKAISGNDRNGSGAVGIYGGVYQSTSAITSINFGAANWYDAVGSFHVLYGVTASPVSGA